MTSHCHGGKKPVNGKPSDLGGGMRLNSAALPLATSVRGTIRVGGPLLSTVGTSLFAFRTSLFVRVLRFSLFGTSLFPRSFRVLAYRSLVLLRVSQHEAQMSAVHRGDGGTPY